MPDDLAMEAGEPLDKVLVNRTQAFAVLHVITLTPAKDLISKYAEAGDAELLKEAIDAYTSQFESSTITPETLEKYLKEFEKSKIESKAPGVAEQPKIRFQDLEKSRMI